jgi:hypothetical protein
MAARLKHLIGRHPAWLWAAFVAFSAGAVVLAAGQSDKVGQNVVVGQKVVVFSITGEWRQVGKDKNGKDLADSAQLPLHWWQTLDTGAGELKGTKDSLIVLKTRDDILHPIPCKKPETEDNLCHEALNDLDKKKGAPTSFTRDIRDAFTRVTMGQPGKYMIAGSRGVEDELTDAVVPLANGQVDLSAVFRDMSSGKYYLAFSAVDAVAAQSSPASIVYTKGQPVMIPAPGLHSGLYRVSLVDAKGEPAGSDAWILLSAASDYSAKSGAYERAVSDSKELPEEMDPATTRALLRAFLESLSLPKQGAGQ